MRIMVTLFVMAALSAAADGQAQAELSFVEGGPLIVPEGQIASVTLDTQNGPAEITASLWVIEHPDPDVEKHWQLVVTNKGGHGQLSTSKRQDVHPTSYVIRVPDPAATTGADLFDRRRVTNLTLQAVRRVPTGGPAGAARHYGIRLANFREPAAIRETPGNVLLYCLDDRPPTQGYIPFAGPYGASPHPDEDLLANSHHRHPGGMRFMWDAFRVKNGDVLHVDYDPMPAIVPQRWKDLLRIRSAETRALRPPRLQAVMDSFSAFNADFTDPGAKSLLWFCTQGEGRWRGFNWSPQIFKLPGADGNNPAGAQHLHWHSMLDGWWGDGHYGAQNNTVEFLMRAWVETRSPITWFILCNWARYQLSASMVWTTDGHDGMKDTHRRHGWCFYEKSQRGNDNRTEPGQQFSPSEYKQPTYGIVAASLVLADHLRFPFALEASIAHVAALKTTLGQRYTGWDGKFGSRIGGYGLMNLVHAYRATGDDDLKDQAIATADNIMSIMRQPARIDREMRWHGPEHISASLGVPYIDNPANSGGAWTTDPPYMGGQSFKYNIFGNGACARGLVEAVTHLPVSAAKKAEWNGKVKQMVEFWCDEIFVTDPEKTLVVCRSGGQGGGMSTPRVPAVVKNGNNDWNIPSDTFFTPPFLFSPTGYAAVVLGSQKARDVFPLIYRRYGDNLDWVPPISGTHWDGMATPMDATGERWQLQEQDVGEHPTEGVDPRHHLIRIAYHDSSGEIDATLMTIRSINGMTVTVEPAEVTGELASYVGDFLTGGPGCCGFRFGITGPFRDKTQTARDMAYRDVTVGPVVAPDTTLIGALTGDLQWLGPDPARPFDWGAGAHFNTWIKSIGPMGWMNDEVAAFWRMGLLQGLWD